MNLHPLVKQHQGNAPERAVKTRLVKWRDKDSGTPLPLLILLLQPTFFTLDISLTQTA